MNRLTMEERATLRSQLRQRIFAQAEAKAEQAGKTMVCGGEGSWPGGISHERCKGEECVCECHDLREPIQQTPSNKRKEKQ